MFSISVGVMAYNEEANIKHLLNSLKKQCMKHGRIKEIIVIASGCTDKTVDIVRYSMLDDDRITLFLQPYRKGKASAVNLFLSKAAADILVLESGDTIPQDGAFDSLIAPFSDASVGMTGARPIPINSRSTFIGFAVHLIWFLHHKISLQNPKMGELVAFRNFINSIPVNTAVDEASIEAIVKQAGYQIRYVPDAIVSNKGPDNVSDLLIQRRRIAAGHRQLFHALNYKVSTQNILMILDILIRQKKRSMRKIVWTFLTIGIEAIARLLGYFDSFLGKKRHTIWDVASSTKRLM